MANSAVDIFIVGGGPSGLAAAIAARQRGFSVMLADGAMPPVDKACGEGLFPDTLASLRALCVTLSESDGFAFQGICFSGCGFRAHAEFYSGPGMGVRRTTLHRKMAEHAQACGATLCWGTSVTEITEDGVVIGGEVVRARWIVGADGAGSLIRKWAGLENRQDTPQRFAFRQHFKIQPWTPFVEVHWGERAQAYVTPVGKEEIGVAILCGAEPMRLAALETEFPELAERLKDATPTSTERGAMTAMRKYARVSCGNIALVGDASGGVDAITGEGLGLAFRQAEALAAAIASGDLRQYEAAHTRLRRRVAAIGRLLLLMDRHPDLRRRALRTLAAEPELFAKFLALHTGATSPAEFAGTGVRFGLRLLQGEREAP